MDIELIDAEEGNSGRKGNSSWPVTRSSTPTHLVTDQVGGGSSSTLDSGKTNKTSSSTLERITGILASFRATREALDDRLEKNRELLQYVDKMQSPTSKRRLNIFQSTKPKQTSRSCSHGENDGSTVLPLHDNDKCNQCKEVMNNYISGMRLLEKGPATPSHHSPGTTDARNEVFNVEVTQTNPKAVERKTKQSSKPFKIGQRKLGKKDVKENLRAKTKDYGDLDFHAADKSTYDTDERTQTVIHSLKLGETSFPRHRRPYNKFGHPSKAQLEEEFGEEEIYSIMTDNYDPKIKTKHFTSKLKSCLKSVLVTVICVIVIVFILMQPSIQLYIRNNSN